MHPRRWWLAFALALPCPAFAAPPSTGEPRLITVTGDADVHVIPDEVFFTLSVESRDKDIVTAKTTNDRRVANIFSVATASGIDPKRIQTDLASIEPTFDYHSGRPELVDYVARKTLVICLTEVSRYEDVLTKLLAAGANYVHGVEFRTTELRKYRDQARTIALHAAQDKAAAMARDLGLRVGRAHAISEVQEGSWGMYSRNVYGAAQNAVQNASAGSESAPVVGQITVNAKVNVSFELE